MIRPGLGGQAFPATLTRHVCVVDGQVLSDENPEHWALADATEPQLVVVAAGQLALISTSVDESRTRAYWEADSFPPNGPLGPTVPRMGDFIAIEVGPGIFLVYQVALTRGEVDDGVPEDLAENELLLTQHGFWIETCHEC